MYAINPDGTKKWSFPIGEFDAYAPVIGADGTIYVGSAEGKLYAISDGSRYSVPPDLPPVNAKADFFIHPITYPPIKANDFAIPLTDMINVDSIYTGDTISLKVTVDKGAADVQVYALFDGATQVELPYSKDDIFGNKVYTRDIQINTAGLPKNDYKRSIKIVAKINGEKIIKTKDDLYGMGKNLFLRYSRQTLNHWVHPLSHWIHMEKTTSQSSGIG